jgi:hypothetical protein
MHPRELNMAKNMGLAGEWPVAILN